MLVSEMKGEARQCCCFGSEVSLVPKKNLEGEEPVTEKGA